MKEISPLSNISNLPAALSSLNRFFAPVDVEVANHGQCSALGAFYKKHISDCSYGFSLSGCAVNPDEGNHMHGQNVVMISQLFAKLCAIQKSDKSSAQSNEDLQDLDFEEHANSITSNDENVKVWSKNSRRVSSENLVFVWGLSKKMTAAMLKKVLEKSSHAVFAQEFDVKYIDRSCAVVVFWESGSSETFLREVNNEEQLVGCLREMVAEGLRVAGYETYRRACRLGFWEADLAEALDKTLESSDTDLDSDTKPSDINWSSELAINFDEL